MCNTRGHELIKLVCSTSDKQLNRLDILLLLPWNYCWEWQLSTVPLNSTTHPDIDGAFTEGYDGENSYRNSCNASNGVCVWVTKYSVGSWFLQRHHLRTAMKRSIQIWAIHFQLCNTWKCCALRAAPTLGDKPGKHVFNACVASLVF